MFHVQRLRILLFALLLLMVFTPSPLPASGLTVQPATFLFREISPGKKIQLPVPLSIHNKDDQSHVYTLLSLSPSRLGMSWPEGYQEILDPEWLRLEKKEIAVEGGKMESVNMYIEIPPSDAYFNQKWVVAVGVTTRVESGESIALAVYPRFLIETENRREITGRPAGKTGIIPGDLYLHPDESFEIYNNDDILHTYTISTEIPSSEKQKQIVPTPSYVWIPDPSWIVPEKNRVEVAAGGKQRMSVHLKLPEGQSISQQRWEALLYFRSPNGPATFGRVLISQ